MSQRPEQSPETPKPGSSSPARPGGVGFYLAILFAVAFLLLLLAFFNQQRANDEALGNLTQSITSIESLNQLLAENRELREELEAAEEELEAAQSELEETSQALSQLKNTVDSLQLIDELDAAFRNGEYALCLEVLDSMERSSRFTMPESAVVQDRVAEILEALTQLGYYAQETEE